MMDSGSSAGDFLFRRPRPEPLDTLFSAAGISHVRIMAQLGQGGMGVVYRATDERLGCDVAIGSCRRNWPRRSPPTARRPRRSDPGWVVAAFRSDHSGGGIIVMGATGEAVRKVIDDGRTRTLFEVGPGREIYWLATFEGDQDSASRRDCVAAVDAVARYRMQHCPQQGPGEATLERGVPHRMRYR